MAGDDRRTAREPSRRDRLLATALAAGMGQADAGAAAGVSERTVRRRLTDPAFRRLVDAEQDRIVERFAGRVSAALESGFDRLTRLIGSGNEPVALGAVRTLLEFTIRMREHATIARRLTALESADDDDAPRPAGDAGEATGGDPHRPAGGGRAGVDPLGPGEPVPAGGG